MFCFPPSLIFVVGGKGINFFVKFLVLLRGGGFNFSVQLATAAFQFFCPVARRWRQRIWLLSLSIFLSRFCATAESIFLFPAGVTSSFASVLAATQCLPSSSVLAVTRSILVAVFSPHGWQAPPQWRRHSLLSTPASARRRELAKAFVIMPNAIIQKKSKIKQAGHVPYRYYAGKMQGGNDDPVMPINSRFGVFFPPLAPFDFAGCAVKSFGFPT